MLIERDAVALDPADWEHISKVRPDAVTYLRDRAMLHQFVRVSFTVFRLAIEFHRLEITEKNADELSRCGFNRSKNNRAMLIFDLLTPAED